MNKYFVWDSVPTWSDEDPIEGVGEGRKRIPPVNNNTSPETYPRNKKGSQESLPKFSPKNKKGF